MTIYTLLIIPIFCMCQLYTDPVEAFKDSDLIFIGKLQNKELVNNGVEYKYTFSLINDIKSDSMFKSIVYSGSGATDCSYHFYKGKEYIVFGNKIQNRYETTHCTMTRLFDSKGKNLYEIIRKLKKIP